MGTGSSVQVDESVPDDVEVGRPAPSPMAGRTTRQFKLTAVECGHSFNVDAVSCTPGVIKTLLYLSCAAPQASVKAMRAVLYSPKMTFDLQCEWDGLQTGGIGQGNTFERDSHGYDVFTHNMGYNTFHMVAISRRPGFMTTLDDEAVWQQLCDSRYTTPILREWSKYIRDRMVKKEWIVEARGYGCACALMVASDENLDEIVQQGLQRRHLRIE